MRPLVFAGLVVLCGCEKTSSVGDRSSSASVLAPEGGAPHATRSAPASSKSGPTPDDPFLANVSPLPMPPPSEIRPLATANNAFALDLWPRAAAGRANMALSPASLSIALAMTWLGAK